MASGDDKKQRAGGGGGGSAVSVVDSDRLWRDRISQELVYQRTWEQEYGFMVGDAKREQLRQGTTAAVGAPASMTKSEEAVACNTSTGLGKKGSSYVGLKSTAQACYTVRNTPELKDDGAFHRKRFEY